MTAVKQMSVKGTRHMKRLESYLDWERDKALAHESRNLTSETCKGMFREMDSTRRAYGHDRPGRAGCATTFAQHQILAFEASEADMNGGAMTPAHCMDYARDYVAARYPDRECLWVLQKERCTADGTDHYAVHLLVSRTNLKTGRRLDAPPHGRASRPCASWISATVYASSNAGGTRPSTSASRRALNVNGKGAIARTVQRTTAFASASPSAWPRYLGCPRAPTDHASLPAGSRGTG